MLNAIPSPDQIIRAFEQIDLADVSAGVEWYADAYGIAADYAERYGCTVEQAAGVIAALSPQQGWAQNVRSAERFLADNSVSVHTRVTMDKCRRILAADSRESILAILNADKTQNFFLSIATQGAEGVCIDRHAIDIALGVRHTEKSRPSIGKRLYRAAADAYRVAAERLNAEGADLTPAEVQAVTWAAHVARWSGVKMSAPVAL
jgi:hypothetical protein